MKVNTQPIKNKKPEFVPLELCITFETLDELGGFYSLVNNSTIIEATLKSDNSQKIREAIKDHVDTKMSTPLYDIYSKFHLVLCGILK